MRHNPASGAIVIMLRQLKMHGMAQAVGELTEQGSPAFEAAIPILSQLLKAETAEREVRSTAYQLKTARFPAYRDLNGFDFASSEINEALVRQLHRCEFLDDANNIVLVGGPGTGKTHLACAIGNAVMESSLASVLFVPVSAMLRSIKETYRKASERSEQQAINDFCEPDLLILDEVGVQVGSEHEKLLMFEVLNERYQHMLPTILISNLPPDELEGFLGQRVMDRYRECGSVIAFNWASHRGQR